MLEKLKKHRRLLLMLSMIALVFVLAACAPSTAQNVEPIGPNSTGLWDRYILYNLSRIIIWSSELFGGNYGIGIIVVTFLFRALLIPLTNMQHKSMGQMNEVQPKIEALKEQYSDKDVIAEKTQEIYDEHGVNPFMGCLPLIIQMPIFIAVFQAVSRTPQLANESFLWIQQLGQPDPYFIFPILAGVFTFLQSYLMQMNRPGASGKVMSFLMPIMIVVITLPLSAGLAVHFTASNLFGVLQSLIFQNPFKERREMRRKEEEEAEQERQRQQAIRKAKRLGRSVKKK